MPRPSKLKKNNRRARSLGGEQLERRSLLAGDFGGAFSFGSSNSVGWTVASEIAADANGNHYVAGTLTGTVDFAEGFPDVSRTANGAVDAFVAKYGVDGALQWVRHFGGKDDEEVSGVAVDAAGNVYVTGQFYQTADFDPGAGFAERTSAGSTDAFLLKLSAQGDFQSVQAWGGTRAESTGGVALDASGNVYVLSDFEGEVDFDPTFTRAVKSSQFGTRDIALSKFAPDGTLVRLSVFSGTGLDSAGSLAVAPNGEAYLSGTFTDVTDFDPGAGVVERNAQGNIESFVVRLDAAGHLVYVATWGTDQIAADQGLAVDAAGSVWVAGSFLGSVDFNPGPGQTIYTSAGDRDAFVLKLTPDGSLGPAYIFGGSSADEAQDVALTSSGEVLLTGKFSGNAGILQNTQPGGSSVFVVRLNAAAQVLAANSLEGTAEVGELAIAANPQGTALVSGYFTNWLTAEGAPVDSRSAFGQRELFVAKVANGGNSDFLLTAGSPVTGTDEGQAIAVDTAGNVFLAGVFSNVVDVDPGPGVTALSAFGDFNTKPDAFVAKYAPTGELLWAADWGGPLTEVVSGVALDPSGNVYVAGKFGGTVDFDPGPGETNIASAGEQDIFLLKLNAAGQFVTVATFRSQGTNDPGDLATDASGNVYLTGTFFGTADFDPGPGVASRTDLGFGDLFVAKFTSSLQLTYVATFGSTLWDEASGLAVDAGGNVAVTGFYGAAMDFDPGPGQALRLNAGGFDAFVIKLNTSGNLVYASTFVGASDSRGTDVALDSSGNAYVAGSYTGTVDFDPGIGIVSRTTPYQEGFIVKLTPAGDLAWVNNLASNQGGTRVTALAVDSAGALQFTGVVNADSDLDPGVGVVSLPFGDFVARWTPEGQFAYAKSLQKRTPAPDYRFGGDAHPKALAFDPAGNVLVTGSLLGEMDLDPGSAVSSHYVSSIWVASDVFVARLINNPTGTLSATMDGVGNLVIADQHPTGKDNVFSIEVVSDQIRVTSTGEQFYVAPRGGAITEGGFGVTFPLSQLTGTLVVDGQGGADTFFVGELGSLRSLKLIGGAGNDQFGSATQRLGPRRQTSIAIVGDLVQNDKVFVDLATPAARTAVILDQTGSITAKGYLPFVTEEVSTFDVLTASGAVTIGFGGAILHGTDGNDVASVAQENPSDPTSDFLLRVNDLRVRADFLVRVSFYGGNGNDLISTQSSFTEAELIGNDGDDFLIGTDGEDDVLDGGSGNDRLFGRSGNDYIQTGNGTNYVSGGSGNDRIYGGGGGVDTLKGDAGDDVFFARSGNDVLYGGAGHDVMIGSTGVDLLYGGAGNDLMIAGSTTNSSSVSRYDAADQALMALLANWVGLHPAGIANGILSPDDGESDTLYGETGDDDFYTVGPDLIPDFNAAGMGSDRHLP